MWALIPLSQRAASALRAGPPLRAVNFLRLRAATVLRLKAAPVRLRAAPAVRAASRLRTALAHLSPWSCLTHQG